tara:strand:- start:21078 stop:21650 length:573 start_codon:yes stop_codon:yes gene_type:complete
MEAALELLLPKILGEVTFTIHPHQGKEHLLGTLPSKLQGYAGWLPESFRIVVVIDRDSDDCKELKKRLDAYASSARKLITPPAKRKDFVVVNRIVIEELEAWYFGDWEAVREAYPRVGATIPANARYRHPDEILGGTWEAFERILKRAGYHQQGLRKIEAARDVAARMEPARNTSPSFVAFRDALTAMVP